MRFWRSAMLLVGLAIGGCGVLPGLKGNDTGGIISWSPENEALAPQLAADHCARFGKVALMTSVRRGEGYFINFICTFTRNGRPVRY